MSDQVESPKPSGSSGSQPDTTQVIVVQLSAKLKKAPPGGVKE